MLSKLFGAAGRVECRFGAFGSGLIFDFEVNVSDVALRPQICKVVWRGVIGRNRLQWAVGTGVQGLSTLREGEGATKSSSSRLFALFGFWSSRWEWYD